MKSSFGVLVIAILVSLACNLTAPGDAAPFQGQRLRVQFWPGATATAIQKYIISPFVKDTGANVVVEYGNTSASIAKARAQRNDPQLDVVFLDELGVLTLAREGILQQLDLDKISHAHEIYPGYVLGDRYGIGTFTYAVTLLYNDQLVKSPPTSWRDLWRPQYRGKFIGPPVGNTQALLLTVMAAKLNGGDLDNIAAAWPMLQQLKPNVHSFPTNNGITAELMRSGDALLTINSPTQFKEFIDRGYPIAKADLKEGYFGVTSGVALIKRPNMNRDLAYALIGRALSPEAQSGIADDLWFGATNPRTVLSATARKYVVTPQQYRKAIPIDQAKLIQLRPTIIDGWNKVFTQ